MGDRGNIVMNYGEGRPEIFFYTHWRGSDLKTVVQEALVRGKERWGDDAYLSRIIFDTLTDGNRDVTGFGITPFITDNEHNLIVVTPEQHKVEERTPGGRVVKTWEFPEFIEARFPSEE